MSSEAPLRQPEFETLSGPRLDPSEIDRVCTLSSVLAACRDGADDYPCEAMAELAENGFLAEPIPVIAGGAGASIALAARLLEEMARYHGSLGWLMNVQYGLHYLLPTLTNGQPEPYFHDIVTSKALFAGAPGHQPVDRIAPDGSAVYTGTVRYCSGAPIATWITTTAGLPDGQGCTLMIRSDSPGLSCEPSAELHGMRGSMSGHVQLDGVCIPREHVHLFADLDDPASRPRGCRYFGGWPSLLLQNAVFIGVAWHAVQSCLPVLQRKSKRLSDPSISIQAAALGRATTDLFQARSLFYQRVASLELAAQAEREQDEAGDPAHLAILSTVANLTHAATARVLELAGGSALLTSNEVEGCWRDIQLARVAEGSHLDVAHAALGRWLISHASLSVAHAQGGEE